MIGLALPGTPIPRLAPDVEILDTAESVLAYRGNNPAFLVTGDLNMRIRAAARSIQLNVMPDSERQPLGEELAPRAA